MTRPGAASYVVERCPRCGVEHDTSAESICEACDTPLRPWCRVHGRETGWLDGPACTRCAKVAKRPARRTREAAAPRPLAYAVPAPVPPPEREKGRVFREVLPVLWTTLVCVLLCACFMVYPAVRARRDVGEAVLSAVSMGVIVGVFLGVWIADARLYLHRLRSRRTV
jgi:hypothetical protein